MAKAQRGMMPRRSEGRTILEIGFGPNFSMDAGMEVKRGDHYIAADLSRHMKEHAIGLEDLEEAGIKLTPIKADGLVLPLKDKLVDHIVMHNVLSEQIFPNASVPGEWRRKKRLSFRKAIEKLEAEMHRVSKPGATAFLSHEYMAEILHMKDHWPFGKTRMQHLRKVFSNRWVWEEQWGTMPFQKRYRIGPLTYTGKLSPTKTLVIRLRKKTNMGE